MATSPSSSVYCSSSDGPVPSSSSSSFLLLRPSYSASFLPSLFLHLLLLPLLLLPPTLVTARPIGTQPNFLILFPDQWRFDWAGNVTYSLFNPSSSLPLPLTMPTFTTYVNQGIMFTKAHVPSPLCAPSRSCLAAGKEYDEAGVPDNFSNDYPINQTTFYSVLRSNGYYTMTTGKDDLTKATGPGLNGTYHANELGWVNYSRCDGKDDVTRNATPSDPYGYYCSQNSYNSTVTYWKILETLNKQCCSNVGGSGGEYYCTEPTLMPQDAYEDNYIAHHALKLLDTIPTDDTPWYLQVNFAGPHPPFIVTAGMMNTTENLTYPTAVNNTLMTVAEQEIVRRDYAAELQNLDTLFASILAKVLTRSDAENTLVIFASDHGEELGDHNNWGKMMPWSGSASVPFVIAPLSRPLGEILKIPSNTIVQTIPVSTMDIAGTVLDYGGTQPVTNMTTVSLRSLISSSGNNHNNNNDQQEKSTLPNYRSYVSSGLGEWRMVVQSTMFMDNKGMNMDRNPEFTGTSNDTIYKFICCKGTCPGQPGNSSFVDDEWRHILGKRTTEQRLKDIVGGAQTTTNFLKKEDGKTTTTSPAFVELLYDTDQDPYDTTNIAMMYPNIVKSMKTLLPKGWCNN